MCNHNSRPYPVEQCSHGIRHYLNVERAGIRSHLPEVLVQRFRITRELYAFKKVGPVPHAEVAEPKLIVSCRRDGCFLRAAPGISTSRLVYQVNSKSSAQKNILKSFTSIRSAFPCFGELSGPMQEDQGQFVGVYRNLIKDVGMISMQCLSRRICRGTGVKRTGRCDDFSPCRETPLLLNHQGGQLFLGRDVSRW